MIDAHSASAAASGGRGRPHGRQVVCAEAKLHGMAEIHIHRVHGLSRDAALALARDWQAQAEQDWGLRCKAEMREDHLLIAFERTGLQGQLRVGAEAFDLQLALGFLLSAYRARIEAELQRRLDGWLDTVA
jgi:putative polyhydroxyalkanoate system protein